MSTPISLWRQTKHIQAYLGKTGTIVVWTKIFVPPAGYEQEAPYLVGIIAFDNGERKTLQLVDCDETKLQKNQKVITVLRRIGSVDPQNVIRYGIKAKPLL